MRTIVLLFFSNVFMTFAGMASQVRTLAAWKAILVSWLIALVSYCLAVPANRFGFAHLRIPAEDHPGSHYLDGIMISPFTFLKEKMAWNSRIVRLAHCGGRGRVCIQAGTGAG